MEPVEPASPAPRPECLAELLARSRPRILGILKAYQIPAADAEDLVQDTVVAALTAWARIENLESWFVTVLRRQCSRHHRRAKMERACLQPADLQELDLEDTTTPHPRQREAAVEARALLASLTCRHRRALILRYYFGLGYDEIAQRLGWSGGDSSRRMLWRILRRLEKTATAVS